MAAVGYSKLLNKPGLIIVSSGCGSTNAITGVLDAWQDSYPLIIISGQANKDQTTYLSDIPLRKLGVQEVNIIEIIKSITKFSKMIVDPNHIQEVLEEAYHLCISGRPGPVWIDVPIDIQSKIVDTNNLSHWKQNKLIEENNNQSFEKFLKESERPIIVAGNGVHLSNARNSFRKFIEKYNIPCVFTFLGTDLLPSEHHLNVGRMGIKGSRSANFAVANSDLVISIGASMSIPSIGFQYHLFAREAKKIAIDIDKNEHLKDTIKMDEIIEMDAKKFLESSLSIDYVCPDWWVSKCEHWKTKWDVFDRPDIKQLNMYSFSKKISQITKDRKSAVVTDSGSAYYVISQTISNNRVIIPGSQGEMGFAIPASIGVSVASDDMCVLAITGDGSFQFNIQELQTIVQNKLPIKIFVLNNGGYLSIRNTQIKYFDNRFSGVDKDSGVSFPNLGDVAQTYGINFYKISNMRDLNKILPKILNDSGCCLCEVICPLDEKIYPTAAAKQTSDGSFTGQPLENMSPFLSSEELKREMIISLYDEK
jgi:acetolactate synthase-1/2/3 large subunit